MRRVSALFSFAVLMMVMVFGLTGCTLIFQKGRRKDVEKINQLQNQISDLERAKKELEDRLRSEIANKEVNVNMSDRGLVITFVAEVLFDSGKDKLKADSLEKLEKVANVLNTTVHDLNVGIEGHTDNEPIKKSGWKSNWELSVHRALSVLHYMIDDLNVDPTRLSAAGYGEYRPVTPNDTREGRQKNRRVEILILPNASKEVAVQSGENTK